MPPVSAVEREDPDLPLVRRAQQGDFSAFSELVNHHQQHLFHLAWRITGRREDAEDVVQQALLSVMEHLRDFRAEAKFRSWLIRVAANQALKLLRKRRGLPTVSLDQGTESDDAAVNLPHPEVIAPWKEQPDQLAERAEIRQLLDAALQELDDKHRLVFILRDQEGLSVQETAHALDISEANVKVRLLRARLALRERLTRQFGDLARRLHPDHEHG